MVPMLPIILLVAGSLVALVSMMVLFMKSQETSGTLPGLFFVIGIGVAGYGMYEAAGQFPDGLGGAGEPTAGVGGSGGPGEMRAAGGANRPPQLSPDFYRSIALFRDTDRSNNVQGREQIFAMGPEVISNLIYNIQTDESPTVREESALILGQFGETAVEPLRAALLLEAAEGTQFGSRFVPDAFGAMGTQAISPLSDLLQHQSPDVRRLAVRGLSRTNEEAAAESLLAFLPKAENLEVKVEILKALGRLGKTKALDSVIEIAKKAEEPELIDAALGAVGYLSKDNERTALKALDDYLNSEDWKLRKSAVTAMGYTRSNRAVRPLLKRLEDDHNQVRAAAAFALSMIGDKDTMYKIQDKLKNEDDPFTKRMMQQAVQQLNKL